jgi:hypothetical protein
MTKVVAPGLGVVITWSSAFAAIRVREARGVLLGRRRGHLLEVDG